MLKKNAAKNKNGPLRLHTGRWDSRVRYRLGPSWSTSDSTIEILFMISMYHKKFPVICEGHAHPARL